MTQISFEGIEEMQFQGHISSIRSIGALRDGGLISGSYDQTAKVWNSVTGYEKMTLMGHLRAINGVCQLENDLVATASSDHTIILWEVEKQVYRQQQRVLGGHGCDVLCLCLCPLSNNQLASGDINGTTIVWNGKTGEKIMTLRKQNRAGVFSILQLHNGLLATGSCDKTIQLWDLQNVQSVRTLKGHTDGVACLCQLKDGTLASGSYDGTIKIWDVRSGECLQTLHNRKWVLSLCQLHDGKLLSGFYDTVSVWNVQTKECEIILPNGSSVCQLMDGRVATGTSNGIITLLR